MSEPDALADAWVAKHDPDAANWPRAEPTSQPHWPWDESDEDPIGYWRGRRRPGVHRARAVPPEPLPKPPPRCSHCGVHPATVGNLCDPCIAFARVHRRLPRQLRVVR